METVEIIKAYKEKSNDWKPGDRPTVSKRLADTLRRGGFAKATKQAPLEQFKPKESKEEE